MLQRSLSFFSTALFLALTSSPARAQITHLECFMDGSQEIPPVVTPATGRADYILNTANHTLKYSVSFSGLTANQNGAHLHNTSTTGIVWGLPLGSPIFGSLATNATNEALALSPNGTYTNIHTTANPGGEIRGTNVLAPPVGTKMCFGDGTSGPCPCGNTGAVGKGCQNELGNGGALLEATGHVSPDNVVMITTGTRPTSLTILMQGNVMIAPANFGDGIRCLNGIKRLSTKTATSGASAYPEGAELSITARAAQLNQPNPPGSTRWYQSYYRDGQPFCTAETFNSTNMVEITW
ncbi:MAG: CHRD domain-containing protein [Planctomycetota bacterium]